MERVEVARRVAGRLAAGGCGVGDEESAVRDIRELRNACAGDVEATKVLLESGACDGLVRALVTASKASPTGDEANESQAKFMMFALQTLLNAGMDDPRCLTAAWESSYFQDALVGIAALRGIRGAKTHGLACTLVNACLTRDADRMPKVVDMAQSFWLAMLRASAEPGEPDGVGGGAHLPALILEVCCKRDGLPRLFRGLSPNGDEVAAHNEAMLRARLVALAEDDSRINEIPDGPRSKALRLKYVPEQATLLHFIAALMDSKAATSYVDVHHSQIKEGEQPPLLMPEGVLAFLVDTTSVVAARFAESPSEEENGATLSILMECVSVLRAISEREVRPHAGDTIACLAALGLIRLALTLLASLPPPLGIGQTSKATGPAAAPKLEAHMPKELKSDIVYPNKIPWNGYRVDLIAIIGNACFNRVRVCEDIAKLGGIPVVLNHTRGEDGEAYLREWALWAVRNMTQGSDLARKTIVELQPQAVEESEELLSRGLGVELNKETGKPRVVKQPGASSVTIQEVPEQPTPAKEEEEEEEEEEFTIPANWKVTEL
jgi:ataxin-10